MSNETTTKFTADISKFKKAFSDAQKSIRLANSEFKKTSATMDDWSKSTDGLQAKIEQLNTVVEAEKQKLESLENQYKAVVKEQGENSAGAQDLLIKINNQSAAVAKAESNLQKYTQKLLDLEAEQSKIQTEYEKTSQKINEQESDLQKLKQEYANLVLSQGKSSDAAQEVAAKIGKLSTELDENKKALQKADEAADEFDNSLEKVEDSSDDLKESFTVMKGAVASLLADGIKQIGSAFVSQIKTVVTESDKAYSSFQAKTGESTESMAEFKDQMNELYKNNYGESLQDIADKMAYVKQVTGEVDPSKISKLTENAIALEDTFGSDFNETIRGVSNLMEHFEIDAEEAFDLFAKGSQKGLDYTDELGDNIAEYGGNFAQAGYSAEEYFQLLENGSQGGAYNLDKVNDSINEIKNRIGDGTINKNLKLYSKNTKGTFKEWKNGKATMKDVVNSIVKDINDCTNEQDALNMAATAFGTMGEDANLDVVKSLTTLGDTYEDVGGTMEELKEIKYDNIEDDFKAIGRSIQIDFLAPLAQKALPYAQKFTDYCINNLDKVVGELKAVGTIATTVFTINKAAKFKQSVDTLIGSLGKADGLAKKVFNVSPAPLKVATAVGSGFVLMLRSMINEEKENAEALKKSKIQYYERTEAQKKLGEEIRKTTESMKEAEEARKVEIEKADALSEHNEKLSKQLEKIVDKNGKVKKGYEDEAKVITSQLSDALGINIELVDNQIKGYDTLKKKIKNVIVQKKAEAIQSIYGEDYENAIVQERKLLQLKSEKQKQVDESTKKLAEAEKNYYTEYNKFQRLAKMSDEDFDPVKEGYNEYTDLSLALQQTRENYETYWAAVETARNANNKNNKELKEANNNYLTNQTLLTNYDNLSKAIASGNEKRIVSMTNNLKNNFITAKNGTQESLAEQLTYWQSYHKDLQKAVEDGTEGVTKKQVEAAEKMEKKSEKALEKFNKVATKQVKDVVNKINTTDWEKAGENGIQGFINGFLSKMSKLKAGVKGVAVAAITTLQSTLDEHSPSRVTKQIGIYFSQGFINGIKSLYKKAKIEAKNLGGASIDGIMLGVDSGDYEGVGKKLITHFTNGINSQSNAIIKSMKSLITSAIKGAQESINGSKGNETVKKAKQEFADVGQQMIDSFTDAFEKGASKAVTKVENALTKISESYQEKYDEIMDKQDSLKSTLSDYGDLFEMDDDGNIQLSDLKAQTKYLQEYGDNLESLKTKVSSDLMSAITSMSAEDGAVFASKLMSLSASDLKAFDNAYLEKQKAASQISQQYYKSEVDSLKKNFTNQVNKQLKTLKTNLTEIGKQSLEGFISGFNKKSKKANKTVQTWAENIIKTIKKELKIKSPSRVFRDDIAGNIISGFVKGIATRTRSAVNTVRDFTTSIVDGANSSISNVRGNMSASTGNAITNNNNTATYNFYQTNNSPKALSRLEIYRQSNNALKFIKGVALNV